MSSLIFQKHHAFLPIMLYHDLRSIFISIILLILPSKWRYLFKLMTALLPMVLAWVPFLLWIDPIPFGRKEIQHHYVCIPYFAVAIISMIESPAFDPSICPAIYLFVNKTLFYLSIVQSIWGLVNSCFTFTFCAEAIGYLVGRRVMSIYLPREVSSFLFGWKNYCVISKVLFDEKLIVSRRF